MQSLIILVVNRSQLMIGRGGRGNGHECRQPRQTTTLKADATVAPPSPKTREMPPHLADAT